MKTVAILATLDTKAAEADFMRTEIETLGGKALLIDLSLVGDSDLKADVTKQEVIAAGGGDLAQLLVKPNREQSNPFIVAGATKFLLELQEAGKIDAVVTLGGTQGTSTCAPILQALPYGFPKVMLSTAASGDTSPFVGIKDITMMFAVSDILGLNVFSRKILANAAAAAWGMAQSEQCITKSTAKGVIGMSNLGVLTKGAMHALDLFEKAGYEVITFHAIGAGGDAMEQMMKEGIINAVFDYGLGEIADGVWGVLRAGGPERLTVAGKLGLPQVIVRADPSTSESLLTSPASSPTDGPITKSPGTLLTFSFPASMPRNKAASPKSSAKNSPTPKRTPFSSCPSKASPATPLKVANSTIPSSTPLIGSPSKKNFPTPSKSKPWTTTPKTTPSSNAPSLILSRNSKNKHFPKQPNLPTYQKILWLT